MKINETTVWWSHLFSYILCCFGLHIFTYSAINQFQISTSDTVLIKLRLSTTVEDNLSRFAVPGKCPQHFWFYTLRMKGYIYWHKVYCCNLLKSIEHPSNLIACAHIWSQSKYHNVVKYLKAMLPQGSTSFLPKDQSGREMLNIQQNKLK